VSKNLSTAREYLRVSDDRGGRSKSTPEQHAENVEAVADRGWTLIEPFYEDQGISASEFSLVQRPAYKQMAADLKAGRFGADVLVVWEVSRGSRQVDEWSPLLKLLADNHVLLYVSFNDKLYNPRDPGDAADVLSLAVEAQKESARTSARITRHTRSTAKKGKPHGKRLYGYDRIYDEVTRELKEVVFNQPEAEVIRRAGREVLEGKTFYSIAQAFNAEGIPPRRPSFKDHRRGLGWTSVAIRQMLEMKSYGGIRKHENLKGDIKAEYEAVWPAMFDEVTWRRLQEELARRKTTDPQGQRVRPNEHWEPKHLLAGIAVCGECGAIMRVGKQNEGRRKPLLGKNGKQLTWTRTLRGQEVVQKRWEPSRSYSTYVCVGAPGRTGFHVAVKETLLDEAIEAAVVARLSRPDVLAVLGTRDEGLDARRAELLEQIEAKKRYLADFAREAMEKGVPGLLIDQELMVRPQINALEAEVEALVRTDPMVLDLVRSNDVAGQWAQLDLAAKRRILKAVVTPVISKLDPAKRGQRGLDFERISLRWH